jgi:hypothetical protein
VHTDDSLILPVTSTRVVAQLHEIGIRIRQGDDGRILAAFGEPGELEFLAILSVEDTYLCVRSQVREEFSADQMLVASTACNNWNRQHRFPVAVVADDGGERDWIVCRYQVLAGNGLTDLQLRIHLECALHAIGVCWHELVGQLAEVRATQETAVTASELETWLDRQTA